MINMATQVPVDFLSSKGTWQNTTNLPSHPEELVFASIPAHRPQVAKEKIKYKVG